MVRMNDGPPSCAKRVVMKMKTRTSCSYSNCLGRPILMWRMGTTLFLTVNGQSDVGGWRWRKMKVGKKTPRLKESRMAMR